MDDLNNPLNTVGLDVSPAILMPYYDEDSSTLFLTGRVRFIPSIKCLDQFTAMFPTKSINSRATLRYMRSR